MYKPMIALNIKGHVFLSFQGKHIIWFLGIQNWKLPTQLIIFLDFVQKYQELPTQYFLIYLPV